MTGLELPAAKDLEKSSFSLILKPRKPARVKAEPGLKAGLLTPIKHFIGRSCLPAEACSYTPLDSHSCVDLLV